jgi:hypothetical protein
LDLRESKRHEVNAAEGKFIMSNFTNFISHQILLVVKSKRMRLMEHAVHIGKTRKAYTILVVQPEGKRPFRTPSIHRDNIKMCLKETQW